MSRPRLAFVALNDKTLDGRAKVRSRADPQTRAVSGFSNPSRARHYGIKTILATFQGYGEEIILIKFVHRTITFR